MHFEISELGHTQDKKVEAEVCVDGVVLKRSNPDDCDNYVLTEIQPGDTVRFIYPRRTGSPRVFEQTYEQFIANAREIYDFDGRPFPDKPTASATPQ